MTSFASGNVRSAARRTASGHAPADPADPANPNGSLRAIAGVMNQAGNVAGLMPHPERASEGVLGSDDGRAILQALGDSAARRAQAGRTPEVAIA